MAGQEREQQCAICSAELTGDHPCPRCGAELVHIDSAKLTGSFILLSAKVTAPEAAPSSPQDGQWIPAFELGVEQGIELQVLTTADTLMLHPPDADPTQLLADTAEVQVFGSVAYGFDAAPLETDYRHAPQARLQLRARVVAMGPDRLQQMQEAVEQLKHDRAEWPELEELARPDDLPPRVRVELVRGPAGQGVRVICRKQYPWQPFGSMLLIVGLLFMFGLGTLHNQYGESGIGIAFWGLLIVLPLLLAVLLLSFKTRTVVQLDATTVSRERGPIRSRRDVSLPTTEVRQLFISKGNAGFLLWLESLDGTQHLVLRGDRERIEFVRSTLVCALRAIGRPVLDAGNLTPQDSGAFAWWMIVIIVLGMLGMFSPLVTCSYLPGCQLTLSRNVVRKALDLAGRCPLVTERLGGQLTWAAGHNTHSKRSIWMMIEGDRGKGQLRVHYDGPNQDPRFSRITVQVDGKEINVLLCLR